MRRAKEDNQPNQPKESKIQEMQDQALIKEFADCIAENEKGGLEQECEPFEHYAFQLKVRLHTDIKVFRDRFVKGYEAIMEVLRSHESKG